MLPDADVPDPPVDVPVCAIAAAGIDVAITAAMISLCMIFPSSKCYIKTGKYIRLFRLFVLSYIIAVDCGRS